MKKPAKLNRIQELDKQLQSLMKKRIQAYQSGMSQPILDQIERMIDELRVELYTETELASFRAKDKGDGLSVTFDGTKDSNGDDKDDYIA